jgi:cytoskeletal protein CcmA (bactofilin family)
MAELRLKTIDEADIDTVLAPDIDFDGELTFVEPLLVKGTLKGKILSGGDLYVNPGATVEAGIVANKVSVKGTVRGDIHAKERLELFENAELSGNVKTADLIVQSGSSFNGSCEMYRPEVEREGE